MRLVVVGGVAAGLSAASRARRIDPSAEILVIEKGRRISWGACGLPYLIEGQVSSIEDLVVYRREVFEKERNIRIRTEAEVTAVRHGARELVLANGERVRYDRLVWAAGARPARRASGGRVFSLHTDTDGERLRAFLETQRPRAAAVAGGGYIGLEAATALRARGLRVRLHHDATTLLNREDPWLTQRIVERLEACGVEVRLNEPADPERLDADLVIDATGMRPNAELLAEAGAALGRTGALAVDEYQETSLRGVFAAGDCCEARHIVSGRPVWIPLGTTANKAGRVAGANAAGRRERFPGVAGTSIVRVAGLAVAVTGLSQQQARREGFSPVEAVIEARDRARYFFGRRLAVQLVADRSSGRLLGAAVLGDQGVLARINTAAAALAARMDVETLAGLDLAYAPPYSTVMDPLLVAAQQLLRML
ncbi:MAG: FAD-dependent oxidoreductase [Bryobacteraceae bacterium]|nr:FAD-dependent oxidoreductase [Bryobacteraceae bacterium]